MIKTDKMPLPFPWATTPRNFKFNYFRETQIAKFNKKPLKTVWPDCKAATTFEKND